MTFRALKCFSIQSRGEGAGPFPQQLIFPQFCRVLLIDHNFKETLHNGRKKTTFLLLEVIDLNEQSNLISKGGRNIGQKAMKAIAQSCSFLLYVCWTLQYIGDKAIKQEMAKCLQKEDLLSRKCRL